MKIMGISVSTTNQDGQSAKDMGDLWGRFFEENIAQRILEQQGDELYVVYTDYESDYTGRYTAILGHKVLSLDHIPEGLIGRAFPETEFRHILAKGPMPEALMQAWAGIWAMDAELKRAYTYDIEVYGERSLRGDQAEVDIFLSVLK